MASRLPYMVVLSSMRAMPPPAQAHEALTILLVLLVNVAISVVMSCVRRHSESAM